MSNVNNEIKIEIAYARSDVQKVIPLYVPQLTTILEAILKSGILTVFPEINLEKQPVGIFGELRSLSDLVKEGERIEIYRSLLIDPKVVRRVKARSKPKPTSTTA